MSAQEANLDSMEFDEAPQYPGNFDEDWADATYNADVMLPTGSSEKQGDAAVLDTLQYGTEGVVSDLPMSSIAIVETQSLGAVLGSLCSGDPPALPSPVDNANAARCSSHATESLPSSESSEDYTTVEVFKPSHASVPLPATPRMPSRVSSALQRMPTLSYSPILAPDWEALSTSALPTAGQPTLKCLDENQACLVMRESLAPWVSEVGGPKTPGNIDIKINSFSFCGPPSDQTMVLEGTFTTKHGTSFLCRILSAPSSVTLTPCDDAFLEFPRSGAASSSGGDAELDKKAAANAELRKRLEINENRSRSPRLHMHGRRRHP
jgi:hypothetical protein